MKSLFSFIGGGINQGPQAPQFPVNAPNDPNFAMGMNMFREMGGQAPNYQPYQAPQYFDPSWLPQWPNFPGGNTPHDWDTGPTDDERPDRGGNGEGEMGDRRKGITKKPLPR